MSERTSVQAAPALLAARGRSSGRARFGRGPRAVAVLAAFFAGLAPAVAHADTRPIDLHTAIDTALKQNDTLLGAETDVDVADAQAHAFAGADDLLLEGSVGGVAQSTEPVTGPFFQQTRLDDVDASVGLWKPLSTGGKVGLTFRDQIARTKVRIDTGAGRPLDIETTIYGPRAELAFIQPLLAGRGKGAWTADRRRAAAQRDARAAQADRTRDELVREVTEAYWELAYADQAVAIEERSLALAQQQLAVTQARAGAGTGAELEVHAVEQAIAARQATLLGAQQARTERALDLRVLMAVDDGDTRDFAAADSLDGDVAAPDTKDALPRALRFSPDLHAIAEDAAAAGIDADVARQDVLPRLDLEVRGGPLGNSSSAGDSFSQAASFGSYDASATLTFSMPLGNHTAKSRYAAARLTEKRLGHSAAEIRGQLTAAVQRALDAVELSQQRIVAAQTSSDLARRNVDLEIARWKAGSGTNFDVLARQDQLADADAALARARADRRIAIANLAYLTGDATGK